MVVTGSRRQGSGLCLNPAYKGTSYEVLFVKLETRATVRSQFFCSEDIVLILWVERCFTVHIDRSCTLV